MFVSLLVLLLWFTTSVTAQMNRSQIIDNCFNVLHNNWVVGTRCWHATRFNFPWQNRGCQNYSFFRPSSPGNHSKYQSAQWLWDSQFADTVMSHRNVSMSIADLEGLLSMQLDGSYDPNFDGMIPEMIFWPQNDTVGDRVENLLEYCNQDVALISQMPVIALNLEAIWRATKDKSLVAKFLPKIVKYHRWWKTREEPGGSCPSILHGWESGMDASPAYDEAYHVQTPRPQVSQMYPQFLSLMFGYGELDFKWNLTAILGRKHARDPHSSSWLMDDSWFFVQDVGLCGVLAHCYGVLARLAQEALGNNPLAQELLNEERRLGQHIVMKHYDEQSESFKTRYRALDGTFQFAAANTVQSVFGPLLVSGLPEKLLANVINTQLLNPKRYFTKYPVPTTSQDDPSFNASYSESDDLMWRGPAWGATNYFTILGVAKHNATLLHRLLTPESRRIVEQSDNDNDNSVLQLLIDRWVAMVNAAAATSPFTDGKSGIWENYDPLTGQGLGVPDLGMSALIADVLIRFDAKK